MGRVAADSDPAGVLGTEEVAAVVDVVRDVGRVWSAAGPSCADLEAFGRRLGALDLPVEARVERSPGAGWWIVVSCAGEVIVRYGCGGSWEINAPAREPEPERAPRLSSDARRTLTRALVAHARAEAAARRGPLTSAIMVERVWPSLPRGLRDGLTVDHDADLVYVRRRGRALATLDARTGEVEYADAPEVEAGVPPVGSWEFERGRARFDTAVRTLTAFRRKSLRVPCGGRIRRSRESRPRMRRAGRSTRATRAGPASGEDGEDGEEEPGGRCEAAPTAGPSVCGRRPS